MPRPAYCPGPERQRSSWLWPVIAGVTSVEGGLSPRWRADGRELYFVSGRRMMAVNVKPSPELTFSVPHELFRADMLLPDSSGNTYQPSTDGSQFLVLLPVGDAPTSPTLTVVTNWQAALHK